jgi:hypothetical protein
LKEYDFPESWPLPDEYLIELGRILSLWGSLEKAINIGISKLAGYELTMDWRSAVMTAHSNFMQRVDILSTLCDELQGEYPHLSEYPKVVGRIKSVQAQRNQFAHSPIYIDKETGRAMTGSLKARGKFKPSVTQVEIKDLQKISAEIHETILDLHHLITTERYKPIWER